MQISIFSSRKTKDVKHKKETRTKQSKNYPPPKKNEETKN